VSQSGIAGLSEQGLKKYLTIVFDHGNIRNMEEMAISKFKATCLAVLERVRKTKKPILVTRFGEPIAEVVPPSVPPRPANWMGSMADSMDIVGDIVLPTTEESDWEALQD
jgi:prevent-host-death family protein